ncbi:MAG: hypothetical protein LBT88_00600 [Oscillospiraceae bacterium]|jgi:hypothetical protein|nr:hypothetical protein [Oscillospiraceae bacterium]
MYKRQGKLTIFLILVLFIVLSLLAGCEQENSIERLENYSKNPDNYIIEPLNPKADISVGPWKRYGEGVATDDNQTILSLQGDSLNFDVHAGLSVDLVKILTKIINEAPFGISVGLELSYENIHLTGTSGILKKGQIVYFYYRYTTYRYTKIFDKVKNEYLPTLTLHDIPQFACLVIDTNGKVIKDTRTDMPMSSQWENEKNKNDPVIKEIQVIKEVPVYIYDVKNGRDAEYYENGDYYIGNFVNGVRSGKGKCVWTNGDEYEGNWIYGERTGWGTYTWANGDKYIGNFVEGRRDGHESTMLWTNGDKYFGDFENNELDGNGIFTWANGEQYIGIWVKGQMHGDGKYIYTNGTEENVRYECGELVIGED